MSNLESCGATAVARIPENEYKETKDKEMGQTAAV